MLRDGMPVVAYVISFEIGPVVYRQYHHYIWKKSNVAAEVSKNIHEQCPRAKFWSANERWS